MRLLAGLFAMRARVHSYLPFRRRKPELHAGASPEKGEVECEPGFLKARGWLDGGGGGGGAAAAAAAACEPDFFPGLFGTR